MRQRCSACSTTPRTATLPETAANDGIAGAEGHFRALETLYASAPINTLFQSRLEIPGPGHARIKFTIDEPVFHAAGAAHGTIYFKMLDDAAFYAANSMVSDRFLLTTGFTLHFTKPVRTGEVIAEGRWISGKRRVFIAEAQLIDAAGDEIGRGTGTFMRSHIALAGLPGYRIA
ncbi:MAG: PaaI family thioesterase [Croceibacterium sp.]